MSSVVIKFKLHSVATSHTDSVCFNVLKKNTWISFSGEKVIQIIYHIQCVSRNKWAKPVLFEEHITHWYCYDQSIPGVILWWSGVISISPQPYLLLLKLEIFHLSTTTPPYLNLMHWVLFLCVAREAKAVVLVISIKSKKELKDDFPRNRCTCYSKCSLNLANTNFSPLTSCSV